VRAAAPAIRSRRRGRPARRGPTSTCSASPRRRSPPRWGRSEGHSSAVTWPPRTRRSGRSS
jgi:hypothetical protein